MHWGSLKVETMNNVNEYELSMPVSKSLFVVLHLQPGCIKFTPIDFIGTIYYHFNCALN